MSILVTGCAGFIGSHYSEFLLKKNIIVIGIDNLNDYYDVSLKQENINLLKKYSNFTFFKYDIRNISQLSHVFSSFTISKVIHLASMAGVRYSLKNPQTYIDNNITGMINILQLCVQFNVKKLIYASSSSVYGNLPFKRPFTESDATPYNNQSPYASSKFCMEVFANTYFNLYNLSSIGLRFFTVYGPRGRPDMAPFKFIHSILNDKTIVQYGDGSSMRDYTYIDDIVNGIFNASNSNVGCDVFNLGNNNPCSLTNFIKTCELVCNKKAIVHIQNSVLGDVDYTCADIQKSKLILNYSPKISLFVGLSNLKNSIHL